MVNLPNHLDQEWQIDIKKSRAKPPLLIRQDLKAIGRAAMVQAEQVFRHREKKFSALYPVIFLLSGRKWSSITNIFSKLI